jgi:hypothetical protein
MEFFNSTHFVNISGNEYSYTMSAGFAIFPDQADRVKENPLTAENLKK